MLKLPPNPCNICYRNNTEDYPPDPGTVTQCPGRQTLMMTTLGRTRSSYLPSIQTCLGGVGLWMMTVGCGAGAVTMTGAGLTA